MTSVKTSRPTTPGNRQPERERPSPMSPIVEQGYDILEAVGIDPEA